MRNAQAHRAILPYIADTALLCTNQQIALRGHPANQVQFSEPPASKEGNFIVILRLLAESKPVLKGTSHFRTTNCTVYEQNC